MHAAPAAAAVGNHAFVGVKGPDGNLYLNQANLGGSFGQWFPMNFATDVAPALAGVGDNVYFFAKSRDGRIFYNRAIVASCAKEQAVADAAEEAIATAGDQCVGLTGQERGDCIRRALAAAEADQKVARNALQLCLGQVSVRTLQNFQGWAEMEGGGRTDAAPAAGAVGNHVFVGVKGFDRNLYLNQADLGRPFGQWFPQ